MPRRPLFEWAQDEALERRHAAAIKAVKDAQYAYRRAPKGKKSAARKALQTTVHTCLNLEKQILERLRT